MALTIVRVQNRAFVLMDFCSSSEYNGADTVFAHRKIDLLYLYKHRCVVVNADRNVCAAQFFAYLC